MTVRNGDPLEPREPERRLDHPVAVVAGIVAFWALVLVVVFGALAIFGIPLAALA